jgi:uncharacterized protein (DUF697 family)
MAKKPHGSGNSEKSAEVAAMASETPEITEESRDEVASKLVDRFALWGGGAGLIPIPLVDMATVAGVQIQMLRRLSQIYGVPFSANRGKSIIAALLGTTIPETSAVGVTSVLKGIPIVGTLATLTMPALAAGATYAIGKVFIQHFASGGTLLDFNPPDYREFYRAQKEKWSRRSAATPPAESASSSSSKETATAST